MEIKNIISSTESIFNYKDFVKVLSASVISLIIGLAVGTVAYSFLDQYLPSNISNFKKGYQSGFDASVKLVTNSPLGNYLQSKNYIRSLSGTITAIGNNSLTLHTNPIQINPYEGDPVIDRTVLITNTTKIIKLIAPTAKALKEAQSRVVVIDGKPSIPIVPLTEVATDISAVKNGDIISVTASENIVNSKQFTATEIRIQPSMLPLATK